MTSDRMMQAVGRLDRAIARLETAVERRGALSAERDTERSGEIARLRADLLAAEKRNADLIEQAREREQEHRPPEPDPHAINAFSHDKALAALRSLDSLIDDLQRARTDG